jgi:hypothetical protein
MSRASMGALVRALLLLAASLVFATVAQAQLFRAYLSVTGKDSNPCTVSAPCRLLPAALNAVANGGEIWILDSANLNTTTVDINKSVSILAVPGAVGSVVATGGASAMHIAAANVTVGLRNLVFTSLATSAGTNGIDVTDALRVAVEDCLFAGLPGVGINAIGTSARIDVRNSVFRHVGGVNQYAIVAQDGPTVAIANSQFLDSARGVLVYGHTAGVTATASVTDSVITGAALGVTAASDASLVLARAIVTRTTIAHGAIGLYSQSSAGSALIVVTGSSVSDNSLGYYQSGTGAVVKSLGNNYIGENGGDSGMLTVSLTR